MRSLVFKKAPIVALTATATVDTINFIIEKMCRYDKKMFVETPE